MKKEKFQNPFPAENSRATPLHEAAPQNVNGTDGHPDQCPSPDCHSDKEKEAKEADKNFQRAKWAGGEFTEESQRDRLSELEDALLRSRADYDNYRKRMNRERQELAEMACESLIGELLPVLDNFERGIRAAEDPASQHLVQGFSLILDQLRQLLTVRQVIQIGKVGEAFDPHQQDALSMVFHGEIPEGHIVEVVRSGYILGKKLLRPASVIVSRGMENLQTAPAAR